MRIIPLLLRHGVDINSIDSDEYNVIYYLFKNYSSGNLLEVLTFMLDNGFDLDSFKNRKQIFLLPFANRNITDETIVRICALFIQHGAFDDVQVNFTLAFSVMEKFILPLSAFPLVESLREQKFSPKLFPDPDVRTKCNQHVISVSQLCRLCFGFLSMAKIHLNKRGIDCERMNDEEIRVWHERETHFHLTGFVKLAEESKCDTRVCHPLMQCFPRTGYLHY